MDVSHLNITQIVLDWMALDSYFRDKTLAKTVIVVFTCFNYILGTILMVLVLHYEKYGEDPQKRGLSNQLIAIAIRTTLVFLWMIFPFLIWLITLPPISYNGQRFWFFLSQAVFVSVDLTFLELLLARFWTIVVSKRMLPLLDDFFGLFFQLANLVIGCWMALVGSYSDEAYSALLRTMSLPQYLPIMSRVIRFQPRILGIATGVLVFVSIFVTVGIKIAKIRDKRAVESNNANLNQSAYNQDLIGYIALFLISMIGLITLSAHLMADQVSKEDDHEPLKPIALYGRIFMNYGNPFFVMVVVPSIALMSNRKMRRFLAEELKELLM